MKFGQSSANGQFISEAIALSGDATLTFSAAGWGDNSTNTLSVSATGATLSGDTNITLTNGEWHDYSVNITGANGTVTLTFIGRRGFIDDITITQPRTAVDVTFSASGYASYCSPYALDLTPTADYAAYTVTATDGAAVTFTKIPGKVAAATPFILYNYDKKGETVQLPIIDDTDEGIAPVGDNMLRGTLSPTYVETVSGDFTHFGLSNGSFAKMTSGTVPANKAYLAVPTGDVPATGRLAILFDGQATGISATPKANPKTAYDTYDLSGQRTHKPANGLYIVNGKKVVRK